MSGIWNRNYTNVLCSTFGRNESNAEITGDNSYSDSNLSIRILTGGYYKIDSDYQQASIMLKGTCYLNFNATEENKLLLLTGIGTTPASYEDYKIETPVINNLSLVTGTPLIINTYDDINHIYTTNRTFSIQNTDVIPVLISEIGLAINAIKVGVSVGCLIYHDVFEVVTLDPNDILLVKIEQSMPLYNYQPYPV